MNSTRRPQSGLTRGVQITELPDGCMNPDPVIMQETDILMEQYLSPTKLVCFCYFMGHARPLKIYLTNIFSSLSEGKWADEVLWAI